MKEAEDVRCIVEEYKKLDLFYSQNISWGRLEVFFKQRNFIVKINSLDYSI